MYSESEKISSSVLSSIDKNLQKSMKHNFQYWHENYRDSLINYPLVWKKILQSDLQIRKTIEFWQNNSNQNVEIILEQFFEMWSYAIRNSDFELAKKSLSNWPEFWQNMTNQQFQMCNEIFLMIEKHWTDLQNKNIE